MDSRDGVIAIVMIRGYTAGKGKKLFFSKLADPTWFTHKSHVSWVEIHCPGLQRLQDAVDLLLSKLRMDREAFFFLFSKGLISECGNFSGLSVHDTTARRVLKLRMKERPPIWIVAANILTKQSRTSDKRWSPTLGVGRSAENSLP
jgi:hypothetical protein